MQLLIYFRVEIYIRAIAFSSIVSLDLAIGTLRASSTALNSMHITYVIVPLCKHPSYARRWVIKLGLVCYLPHKRTLASAYKIGPWWL